MTFHYPMTDAGPLHQEWSAAAYERMQARRDAAAPSWDQPYVIAAHRAEMAALGRLHTALLSCKYKDRMNI